MIGDNMVCTLTSKVVFTKTTYIYLSTKKMVDLIIFLSINHCINLFKD